MSEDGAVWPFPTIAPIGALMHATAGTAFSYVDTELYQAPSEPESGFHLKSARKLTSAQATDLQAEWMEKTQARNGAPPVLPPEIDARMLATAFGVSSVLVNMALQGGLTYQNPAALGEMWWRFELPNGATLTAAQTLVIARMLNGLCKILLQQFSDTAGT